jgi:hypothetical protein
MREGGKEKKNILGLLLTNEGENPKRTKHYN